MADDTVSGAPALFDTVLKYYPNLSARLCLTTLIVQNRLFESANEKDQKCKEGTISDDGKAAFGTLCA